MEEGTWSRRGWTWGERGGGGGYILKIAIAKGGTIFIRNYLGERLKCLKHHTFLNPSLGRNKRSVPYYQNI